MNPSGKPVSISVRRQGLFQFLIGFSVAAVILVVLVLLSQYVSILVIPIGLLLPGAYALAGLAQFITGVRFLELAIRWDSLKGWQRGVLGTFIVLVGGALVIGIIGTIGYWASHR